MTLLSVLSRHLEPEVDSWVEPASDEIVLLSCIIIIIVCAKLIQLLFVIAHPTHLKLLLSLELLLHEFWISQLSVSLPKLLQHHSLLHIKILELATHHLVLVSLEVWLRPNHVEVTEVVDLCLL